MTYSKMLNLSIYMNLGKADDFFKRVEVVSPLSCCCLVLGRDHWRSSWVLWGNRVPVLLERSRIKTELF